MRHAGMGPKPKGPGSIPASPLKGSHLESDVKNYRFRDPGVLLPVRIPRAMLERMARNGRWHALVPSEWPQEPSGLKAIQRSTNVLHGAPESNVAVGVLG